MVARPVRAGNRLLTAAALACAPLVAAADQAPRAAVAPWGVNLAYIDKSVRPGDDFFAYANGNWIKHGAIPSDRTYAGVNLELDRQNESRLKAIVAVLGARADAGLSAEQRKLRDLDAAFLDQRRIERDGLKPAEADLAAIATLKNAKDVARAMGDPRLSLTGLFSLEIGIDAKKPQSYSVDLGQAGLGMPDRDYYLGTDKALAKARAAYKKYLARMLGFAGVEDGGKRAASVYALEARIAAASWPAADRREADKTYNPMRVSALKRLAPGFDWDAFLASAGIALRAPHGERHVTVAEKSAFPKLAAIFAATPVAVWRDFLTVRYLHEFADCLPAKIDNADFAFYGGVLEGRAKQLDRATRAVAMLDATMGEALGKLYVAKYFPPSAKAKALALVDNLLKAYEIAIRTLTWMTPQTRAKALDKLHHFSVKIGYPDRWRDYSALAIARDDLVGDMKNAAVFEWNRELKRLDSPVDRSEWQMTPPTNNAYYDENMNEIVFPAGTLQPPFFDPNADDAVNYGEIGATIGHEISHGFDDQGSKYDANGVLRNWWMPEDLRNFRARTDALARQYDRYEPLPGLHINGRLTLGENIADLAGLVIAHKAYHLALAGKAAPVLDGYSGDQRFYIAYGQSWREVTRAGALRELLLSNPHSPARWRVDGVVRNDDGWYAAFAIAPEDKYHLPPEQRVHLW